MAQAPAQPPTTQTPDPTLWQCHICKDEGPIKYESQKKCASCGHGMCKTCKKDDDIPSPLGTTAARVHASPIARGMGMVMHARDPDIWPTSHLPQSGFTHTRMHARTNYKLSSRPGRPSMAGWWRCHNCRSMNNPALAPRRCSICGHGKCRVCTAA